MRCLTFNVSIRVKVEVEDGAYVDDVELIDDIAQRIGSESNYGIHYADDVCKIVDTQMMEVEHDD